jgi:cytochrome c-type biogenesis protein
MHLTLALVAFLAGLLSFVSPCVLPLTPVYLAQLVGPSIWQGQQDQEPTSTAATGAVATEQVVDMPPRSGASVLWSPMRRATLAHAAAFVAGFSLTFIALGATASVLGAFLSSHAALLRQVGGLVLVALGLHVAGALRLPGLDREWRFSLGSGRRGYPFSFLVGLIFGLGWTPCVGPILAGILVLAAQAGTLNAGVLLLAIYSLGLGVPFLALGLAFDRLAPALKRLTPHLRAIEMGTGALLMVMGVVIFFNWLFYLSASMRLPNLHLP